MGIEPTSRAWEAPILPLNYARSVKTIAQQISADNGEMAVVFTAEALGRGGMREVMRGAIVT